MQELVKQEQFELEVLDRLNTNNLLGSLVFGGGTMLRLCYGLNRFSVDLDFWIAEKLDVAKAFVRIKESLSPYKIRDATDKFYTMLFEIKDKRYPRALKIEIRKEKKNMLSERSIAFSKFGNRQVLLNTVPLKDMMASKIDALVDRKEIRDAFDVEFLLKKGVQLEASAEKLEKARRVILSFTKQDYTAKLGPLLAAQDRAYYAAENFKILLMSLKEKLGETLNSKP